MNYASEDDPVIELVAEWFEDHGGGEVEIDTGALYSALKVLAEQKHLLLPRSASAFGKRLRELEVVLQASLSVIISKSRVGHTTRWKFTASALNQSPENDSSNSPQSTYRPPSIETNVVEMSQVSQIVEEFRRTPEGKYECVSCLEIFGTESGWRAHILRHRCNARTV
jgi:hypothetical protein